MYIIAAASLINKQYTYFYDIIINFFCFNNCNFFSIFQRGSDELLSQSNVSVMAPSAPHADNNNQENAKKVNNAILFHYILIRNFNYYRVVVRKT